MALILNRYRGYFIKDNDSVNYKKYEAGFRSYFDPVCRKFLQMKPEDALNVPHTLIHVPVISKYEIYRTFLSTHGFESVIQSYDSLNEVDFCIAVRIASETDRSLQATFDYFDEELDSVMLQWIVDNGIENCKLDPELYSGPLDTKEDIQEYLRFTKEQVRYEDEQEEDFKKSRLMT